MDYNFHMRQNELFCQKSLDARNRYIALSLSLSLVPSLAKIHKSMYLLLSSPTYMISISLTGDITIVLSHIDFHKHAQVPRDTVSHTHKYTRPVWSELEKFRHFGKKI